MKYNTITKQVSETVPGGIYEGIDYHGTLPADVAARAGWVDLTPEIQAQLDADKAAAAAAEAAARQAYLEGYDTHDRPQRMPSLEISDGDHVYGIVPDGATGEVDVIRRESTRTTNEQFDADREAKRLERRAHRERITGIKTDLDQVETALDGLDLTNAGPLGVAIAATTGATKTALNRTQDALQSLKTAAKNLRQACEKLRREVK
jgi:hypothetical protein